MPRAVDVLSHNALLFFHPEADMDVFTVVLDSCCLRLGQQAVQWSERARDVALQSHCAEFESHVPLEQKGCRKNQHTHRSRMRREVLTEGLQENDLDSEATVYATPPAHSPTSDSEERKQPHLDRSSRCRHVHNGVQHPPTVIKQEAPEVKGEEEEGAEDGEMARGKCRNQTSCVSMETWCPQLKTECEDQEALCREPTPAQRCPTSLRDDGAMCSQVPSALLGSLSPSTPQRPSQSRQEGDDPNKQAADPASFKAASEPARGSLEVSLNSPSAASSPGLMLSVSPVPSSSAPISPSPPNPAPSAGPIRSLDPTATQNTKLSRRRNEKMANLDNIIHRLERAANREETLEWEF